MVTLDGGKDYRRSSEEEPQEKWFTLDQDGFEESWDSVQGKERQSDLPRHTITSVHFVLTEFRAKGFGCIWTKGGCYSNQRQCSSIHIRRAMRGGQSILHTFSSR